MAGIWRYMNFGTLVLLLAACATAAPSATPQGDTRSASSRPAASDTGDGNGGGAGLLDAGETQAPVAEHSVRFAVLGDTGTGERAQYDVAAQLAASRTVFPFEFVIMVGDNMYGSERPQDYARKFELPYKPILDAKVPFYAALGNHDDPNQRFYEYFNMGGNRYYSFKKDKLGNPGVRFFVLDSNYMNQEQLDWLEKELSGSDSPWKIAYFHHPLYSSGGRHGSEVDLRTQLEPLFLKHGVNVVFAGHEHFYERLKPQKGIYYFTAGGSAKLRVGDIRKTNLTAYGFDDDYTFMLVEVAGDVMHFQTLTRSGKRVDSGSLRRVTTPTTTRRPAADATPSGARVPEPEATR